MTKDTAVFESPRCSASDFKLTLSLAGFRVLGDRVDFARGIRVTCQLVSHKGPNLDKLHDAGEGQETRISIP